MRRGISARSHGGDDNGEEVHVGLMLYFRNRVVV